jgi:Peptidase C13 family
MRIFLPLLTLTIGLTIPQNSNSQSIADIRSAENGITTQQGRSAAWYLAQHQILDKEITELQPQKAGVVDAFIIVVGLDADPVFSREARETSKVLSRRYSGAGRSIFLASGNDGKTAHGSPSNIAVALAAVAAKMDVNEDVLILYTTSHGSPKTGIVYQDGEDGFGMLSPSRLANLVNGLGIKRRLIMISACYSGVFIPPMQSDDSIIITAASHQRTSFGCNPGNDWTFFGDALINNAFRKPQPLLAATKEAKKLIFEWENQMGVISSEPQVFIGDKSDVWLSALESRMPQTETPRTGRPAIAVDEPKPVAKIAPKTAKSK